MSHKKILLIPLLFFAFLSTKSILADDTAASVNATPNNHPMGYYISPISTSTTTSIPKASTTSYRTGAIKVEALSYHLLSSANTPANLSSTDTSLPSKDAVDVSSYQSWMTQNDFNALKKAGVKTVVVKLTESTTYTNPYAKSEIQMAQNAGLNIAVYHFADFGNPASEASYFVKVAQSLGLPTRTTMIEDAENTSYTGNWTTASQTFAKTVRAAGYPNVKFYTSQSWATSNKMNATTLGAKNMWIAQYLYGKPSNNNLQNMQYGAWQYSSQMYFTGMSTSSPLDVSIDYSNLFNDNSAISYVYRVYNPNSGEHFYTENSYEAQQLDKTGWNLEGVGWSASTSTSSSPVYRLYNPNGGYHFYTMSSYEKNSLVKSGWRYEGISFRSAGSTPIYRAYNPHNGMHNYTTNAYEQNSLVKAGWKNEGIAFYSE
ncbi:GH25 family lysozyme [Lactococcus nasutitermitis]|uniref:GH25 family lysozyme n=1 Tax=Lactococcus nasutitermitis TaxID=1652957 RepID=A0ABV9JFD3_9LACT|nr:GH25 family lysozyme [Lactococcus nasutitermitis]